MSTSLALAAALHPSAAVCGTPTDVARELIAGLEHLDRERYAGPVGWTDASGAGEWAIALRCGILDETDPRRIRLFAGCGIVAGSDPEAEWAEAQAKLAPMISALCVRPATRCDRLPPPALTPTVPGTWVVVLAGGESRRFGSDKLAADLDGAPCSTPPSTRSRPGCRWWSSARRAPYGGTSGSSGRSRRAAVRPPRSSRA